MYTAKIGLYSKNYECVKKVRWLYSLKMHQKHSAAGLRPDSLEELTYS